MQNPDTPILICALEGALLKTSLRSERLIQGAKHTLDRLLSSRHDLERLQIESDEKDSHSLSIPVNQSVVEFLRAEKARGRRLLLDTKESKKEIANIIEDSDLFDECIDLSTDTNTTDFEYVGSSDTTSKIWQRASIKNLVSSDSRLNTSFNRLFQPAPVGFSTTLKAIRTYQWLKNLLVFVPIITSQQFMSTTPLINTIIMFACFSAVASFGYIVNDLLDLQSDRIHQSKKNRPFASGALSISHGFIIGAVLLVLASIGCLFLPPACALVLAGYLALTVFYSLYLKTKVMMDVVSLGALFTFG